VTDSVLDYLTALFQLQRLYSIELDGKLTLNGAEFS